MFLGLSLVESFSLGSAYVSVTNKPAICATQTQELIPAARTEAAI